MIVVSDTTPIHYLLLVDKQFILPALFGQIIVPVEVIEEMSHVNAPPVIRTWVASTPDWVIIRSPNDPIMIEGLGKGENSAINIATEIRADAILIEDRRGIREADRRGLTTFTILAVLELASINKLIDFADTVHDLSATNFFMPPKSILEDYLRRNRLR